MQGARACVRQSLPNGLRSTSRLTTRKGYIALTILHTTSIPAFSQLPYGKTSFLALAAHHVTKSYCPLSLSKYWRQKCAIRYQKKLVLRDHKRPHEVLVRVCPSKCRYIHRIPHFLITATTCWEVLPRHWRLGRLTTDEKAAPRTWRLSWPCDLGGDCASVLQCPRQLSSYDLTSQYDGHMILLVSDKDKAGKSHLRLNNLAGTIIYRLQATGIHSSHFHPTMDKL